MADGKIIFEVSVDTANAEQELKNFTSNISSEADKAGQDIGESIESGLSDAGKTAQTAGKEIESGLKDGTEGAISAVNDLSDSVEDAAEEVEKSADSMSSALDETADSVKDAANDVGKSTDSMADSLDKASNSAEDLTNSSEKTGKKVKELGDKTEKTTKAEKTYTQQTDKASESTEKLKEKTEKSGSVFGTLKTKMSELTSGGLAGIKEGFSNLKEKFVDTGAAGVALGTFFSGTLSGAIGTCVNAVTEFIGSTVQLGMNFQSAMSEVGAISGASAEQLEQLESTAREYGLTTQFSATEAAEALKYMALAGWDVDKSCSELPGVLNLAAASGMDLAAASDMVTDYLSAFSNSAIEAKDFADLLAYAQGNSNTTAAQLGEAYKNCAASLNAAGQDVQTVTSCLEAMANQGFKSSEAGTALTAIMRDITNAMEDGTIAIGDTTVEVQDANGNYRDLTDILKDVESATNGMGKAEKAAALSSTFTADSTQGLNLLLNEGIDTIAGYEEELRNCGGTAEEMAAKMNDNLEGDLKKLNAAFGEFKLKIWDCIETPLRGLAKIAIAAVTGLNNAFSGVSSFLGGIKSSFQGVSDSLGSFFDPIKQAWDSLSSIYFRNFGFSIENLKRLFGELGTKVQDVFGKIGNLLSPVIGWFKEIGNSVQTFLTGRIQVFIEAISGVVRSLISVAYSVRSFLSTAVDFVSQFVDKVSIVLQPVITVFKKVFDTIAGYFGGKLSSKIDNTLKVFSSFSQSVGDIFSIVIDSCNVVLSLFTGNFEKAESLLENIFSELGGFIVDFFGGLWTFISDTISGWVGNLDSLISNALGIDFTFFTDAWQKVSDVVTGIIDGIGEAVSSIGGLVWPIAQMISEVFTNISTFVGDTFTRLYDKVAPVIEDIKTMFATWGEWISPIVEWFQNLTGEVESNFLPTMSSIWDTISPVFDAILGALQSAWDWYITNMKPYYDGLVAAVQTIGEGIISAVQSIWSAIESAFGFVIDIVDVVIKLLSGDFTGAFEAVKNAGQDLWNAFTSIFEAIGTLVSTAFTAICEAFSGWLETIKNFGSDIVQKIWDGISDLGSWIWDTVSGWAGDIFQTIKDGIGDIGSIGKSIVDGIWGGITGKWEELKENLGNFASSIGDKVKEVLGIHSPSTVFEELGGYLDQGMANGLANAEEAKAQAAALCDMIEQEFVAGLEDVKIAIAAQCATLFSEDSFDLTPITNVVAQMVDTIRASVQTLKGSFDVIFADITDKALTQINLLYSTASSIYQALSIAAQKIVTQMSSALVKLITTMVTSLVTLFKQLQSQIVFQLNSLLSSNNSIWKSMSSQTISIVSSMRSSVISLFQALSKSIISIMQSCATSMRSVGQQMMSELNAGITASKQTVVDTSSDLVKKLVDIFIEGLGIHSPSRKMRWIGEMMIAGLMEGLNSDQIMELASNTVNKMQESYGNNKLKIGTLIETLDDAGTKDLIEYLNNMDGTTATASVSTSVYPLEGGPYDITSWFGARPASDTNGIGTTNHGGIDIGAPSGTAIKATGAGTVTLASYNGGYGNCVIVDHGNGLVSLYGHMSQIGTSVGSTVSAGQTIGYVGSTGNSTGPHLHFEMRQDGTKIDPYPYLQGASISGNTLASALQNALTLRGQGISAETINAMGSNITLGTSSLGTVNTGAYTGVSGTLVDWITQACNITGESLSSVSGLVTAAMAESSGNPYAINDWDSNAAAGHPSKGLMQTIDSTFQAYKVDGMDDIWNPVHNAVAAIRYMRDRYGSVSAVLSARSGGWYGYRIGSRYIPYDMIAQLHEGEMVVPKNENPYANSGGAVLADMFEQAYWQSQAKIGTQTPVIVVNAPDGKSGDTIINQTVEFQETPSRPSEVARKLELTNRKLAKSL